MTTTTTMTTNEAKPFLAAASKQEIAAALKAAGQPGYRADQVYDWIVKKWIVDPALMTNLSASAKEALSAAFLCPSVAIEAEYPADDGSAKYLLRLHDGEAVECARIPAEDGRMTFCLSSQVGCPVSCVFCSSGESGLTRNLAAGEIIEQYFLLCRKLGQAPDNVVMMGIGEPLLNFDNLVAALNVITNPDGVALAQRRVTISTSGWTPGIKALTALRKQWNLALSLHAPDDRTRAMLIPTKFRRDIREILAACQEHREATGRLLTIEYVLLAGINDSPEMGRKFARLAADAGAKVNLIPYNKARGAFERPSREAVKRFENALKTLHVPVTVRVEKGASATAACGQLRANSKKSAAGKAVTLFAALLTLLVAASCFSSQPKELSAHQRELMAQIYSPEEDLAPLYEALSCTDPNFIDPETGRTPLMTAVALSDAPRVSALLASGADPDAKDANGIRAIHYAAGEPDPAILRTLIVGGADVNAKGRTGKTPVMEAARLGMIQNGFPRESSIAATIGGVRTNFRMPDVVTIGLGGGSIVRKLEDGSVTVGPDSVGFEITEKALVFGGDVITATDIAVRLGMFSLGNPDNVSHIKAEFATKAMDCIRELTEIFCPLGNHGFNTADMRGIEFIDFQNMKHNVYTSGRISR